MSAIWEYAPYEGGTLLVLLALADYCNDESGECWPNVASIAAKARLGVRQVNNILAQLKQEGVIISRRGGGRGVSSRYRVDVERLKSLSVKSNSVNPVSVKSATETLQSSSQNPEICDSAIRKNRKEPSLEPSVFESVDPRHAVIRALILELHLKNFRVVCEWNGREGKALNELKWRKPFALRLQTAYASAKRIATSKACGEVRKRSHRAFPRIRSDHVTSLQHGAAPD